MEPAGLAVPLDDDIREMLTLLQCLERDDPVRVHTLNALRLHVHNVETVAMSSLAIPRKRGRRVACVMAGVIFSCLTTLRLL